MEVLVRSRGRLGHRGVDVMVIRNGRLRRQRCGGIGKE